MNGSPSFGQFWEYYRDADGNDQYYSPYSSQQFGTAPREKSGTVSFDVSNNLEMKYRNKKDSLVKVSLIDEIGFNLSYNMAAKKQPWSNLNMRLRMKFKKFNNYTLNMNAVFATYAYTFDKSGNVIVGDRTEWSYSTSGVSGMGIFHQLYIQ